MVCRPNYFDVIYLKTETKCPKGYILRFIPIFCPSSYIQTSHVLHRLLWTRPSKVPPVCHICSRVASLSLHNLQFHLPPTSLSTLWTFFNSLAVIAIMDFAPYQDTSPETARTLSPPPTDRRSSSFSPRVRSPAPLSPPLQGPSRSANPWVPISGSSAQGFGNGNNLEGGRGRLDEFETSLPIRLDYEACLAYLLLPPAGGVLLLVLEHKSDYVRYVTPFPCPSYPVICSAD